MTTVAAPAGVRLGAPCTLPHRHQTHDFACIHRGCDTVPEYELGYPYGRGSWLACPDHMPDAAYAMTIGQEASTGTDVRRMTGLEIRKRLEAHVREHRDAA